MLMMNAQETSRGRVVTIRVVTLLLALVLWESVRSSGLVFEGVMPSSLEVGQALVAQIADKTFYYDLGFTLLAAFVGFATGSIAALAIGIALGISAFSRRAIEPYLIAIGATPKIIFLPILFLIFGLGIESKIAKGAMSAFFPVVLSATHGYLQVPEVLLRVGRSFRLSLGQMIGKIYLPAMAAPLVAGLRLGIAMSIIGVLAAEITYSNSGLGYRLIQYANQFQIASVYAVTILIFLVASATNTAMLAIQSAISQQSSKAKKAPPRPKSDAAAPPATKQETGTDEPLRSYLANRYL
jgi:ABC-type nitrate/sulfonate/bicarbonate transport system permease component